MRRKAKYIDDLPNMTKPSNEKQITLNYLVSMITGNYK